jgi:hypothetical protein
MNEPLFLRKDTPSVGRIEIVDSPRKKLLRGIQYLVSSNRVDGQNDVYKELIDILGRESSDAIIREIKKRLKGK